MASSDFLDRSEKIRLLTDLLEITQNGQLIWEDIFARNKDAQSETIKHPRDDTFLATIGTTFAFTLSSVDHDGLAPYELDVFRGGMDESLLTISMIPVDENGDQEINDLINNLHREVFRLVKRPEEIVRELFQAIDAAKKTRS